MEKLIDYGFKAANVYFSGACNLQCIYCYQPKMAEQMKKTNAKIIEWITSGKMEDDIEKYIGKEIESLDLWGGEQSLNLPYLVERLDSIYERFPKCNRIFFSTNLAKPISLKNIKNFLDKLKELNQIGDRKIRAGIQISLDGPPEINDTSRLGSSAIEILNNTEKLLKYIKDNSIDFLDLNFKGTHSAEILNWFLQPHSEYSTNLEYYYRFFDNYLFDWQNKGYQIPGGLGKITLVYPGAYTQSDGFNYAKVIKILWSKEWKEKNWKMFSNFETQTTERIVNTIQNLKRNYARPWKGELLYNCSCSAGRSMIGLSYDGKCHLCHGSFFFDDDTRQEIKEKNFISNSEETLGYEFKNFDKYLKDIGVVSLDDSIKILRLLSNMENFTNNLSLKIQSVRLQIDNLAQAGQISPLYLDNTWAELATAFFVFGGNDCPIDNLWEHGSIFVRSTSHLKLILNGFFEFVLSYIKENRNLV